MINYIMLTWNRKAFLKDLFQDFYKKVENQNYEFHIIDNGSNDGTQDFLKDLSSKDSRLHVTYNESNKGLEEYKKLLKIASRNNNDYIVIIDDDVLEFPNYFDKKLVSTMEVYNNVGFLALDVVQDEMTNGAKPDDDLYFEESKEGITIQRGPAGGWCAIMRTKDLKKIRFLLQFRKFDMSSGEDSNLVWFLKNLLRKGPAILKGEKCLHAAGPFYSKKYGYLERDIKKYENANLKDMVDLYQSYRD